MTPLKQQLERKKLTPTDLEKVGLKLSRATALFDGADPTISEVRLISEKLRLPIRSLITSINSVTSEKFRLRSNNIGGDVSVYELYDLHTRADTLADLLPVGERIQFAIPSQDKTVQLAESLAQLTREKFLLVDDVSPLIDLEDRIAQHSNAHTLKVNQRTVEGGVGIFNQRIFIFLAERPDARMRFTLAHEFCHYLCDLVSGETSWFDQDPFSEASVNIDERFANAFASALLMPIGGIGEVLNAFRAEHRLREAPMSDVEIVSLARFYGVNFQVAARRLEDLGIIQRGAGQSLYEAVLKKFRSPERLAESVGLPTREVYDWNIPNARLLRSVTPAVSDGRVSAGRLAEVLEMPIASIVGETLR